MKNIARQKRLLTVVLYSCMLHPAHAERLYEGTCRIQFRGTSNMHDFEGESAPQAFTAVLREEGDGPARWSAEIAVPLDDVTTHNSPRDRNMYKMFDKDRFPLIKGVLRDAAIRPQSGSDGAVQTVPLDFFIKDRMQSIDARIEQWRETEAGIAFALSFPISLKRSNLEAPTALFGAVRVGDIVSVSVQGILAREGKPDRDMPDPVHGGRTRHSR